MDKPTERFPVNWFLSAAAGIPTDRKKLMSNPERITPDQISGTWAEVHHEYVAEKFNALFNRINDLGDTAYLMLHDNATDHWYKTLIEDLEMLTQFVERGSMNRVALLSHMVCEGCAEADVDRCRHEDRNLV